MTYSYLGTIINRIKKMLTKEVDVILGTKIYRTPMITLSLPYDVDKVVDRFKPHGIKETNDPFLPPIILPKNIGNGK